MWTNISYDIVKPYKAKKINDWFKQKKETQTNLNEVQEGEHK